MGIVNVNLVEHVYALEGVTNIAQFLFGSPKKKETHVFVATYITYQPNNVDDITMKNCVSNIDFYTG